MKRTLAAIMALVMALTLLPAAALAEGDLATPAGLAWDTDGTTATWKAVENAQGYYVALYSGEHSETCGDKNKIVSQQTTDTKYNFAEDMKTAGAGDYHFHVVATASGMADSGKAFSDKIAYAPVVAVTGVTVQPATATIETGKTLTLTATVEPANATNRKVDWSSDNTGVATVDENGVVTAVAAGKATITVKTQDGEKTATAVVTVKAPASVSGVAINSGATTVYAGESVKWTAGVSPSDAPQGVTWSSSDPAVATVSSEGLITGVRAGKATIIATSESDSTKSASREITVKAARTLTSITITTPPNKTSYNAADGEVFDPTGIAVRATFSDKSTATIDASGLRFLTAKNEDATKTALTVSDKAITVSYTFGSVAKSAQQAIIVSDGKLLTGVKLDKTNEKLPLGGTLQLNATLEPATASDPTPTLAWSSSNTSIATVTSTGLVTPKAIGTAKITVTATQVRGGQTITKTATCTLNVTAKGVSSISVQKQPNRTTYRIGEKFDPTGMELLVSYSDGTTAVIPGSQASYSATAFNATGSVNFPITYGGHSTSVPLNVVDGKLESISVKDLPRITYGIGESFDKTGLTVTANFEGGASTTIQAANLTCTYTAFTSAGTKSVTISYSTGGVTKSTTLNVTVTASKLKSIAIQSLPDKTEYYIGEYFNKNGLSVTAELEDGTTYVVPASKLSFAPTSAFTSAGTKSVAISYAANGVTKTASLNVTVYNAKLTALKILTEPAKTEYKLGDTLNKTGLTARATFSNGTTRDLVATELACTPTSLTTAGIRTITVSYTLNGVKVADTFVVNVSSESSSASGTATIVNCNKWVNVRSGPSTGYAKIGTAAKGKQYKILGISGNWYKVQYGSKEGWIYNAYVSTTGGSGTATTGVGTIVNCNSWVNVRKGPSTGHAKLGTAAKGTKYEILGYTTSSAGNRWYKIRYGNQTAYVFGKYLSVSEGSVTPSVPEGYGKIYNCNSWVNVRSGPGTNYNKIGKAPKNSTYQILGSSGDWYKIQYTEKQIGWVHGQYFFHS